MANFEEQLTSPVLRRAEIKRLTRERDKARQDGRENDAAAFEGVLLLFTDYDQGIVRCYECGAVKSEQSARLRERPADGQASERGGK